MATGQNQELTDRFIQFYRNYYREAIGQLAQQYPNEKRSLLVDYDDLYRFDADLAEDYLDQPDQLQEYAEEALRLYDLPADVKLGQAHVRIEHLPSEKNVDIRDIRVHDDHIGKLIAVSGIVRKATDVRPKITEAAFECQRCGTMTYIPQSDGNFQEPHECQGCERQGPFRVNFDQSEFVDSQKVRIQESPEGLRGGETPQSIDVNLEDDVTGRVTAGDQVTMVGVLHIEQMGNDREKSPVFDLYMDGVSLKIDDEEFEDMDITDEDKREIVELSSREDLYEAMVASVAPSIYGYDQQKLSMILQLFSGVTKHLPDGSRIRGDLHMLLIGDPGTGKCVAGDTRVTLADGREVPIRDLVESNLDNPKPVDDGVWDEVDFEVPSLQQDGTFAPQRATKVWKREAPDQLYRLRTESGHEIEVTPSHPLFVQSDGQFEPVVAENLSEGQFVAAPKEVSTEWTNELVADYRRSQSPNAVRLELPDEWTPWLARLVGYVIAEGYVEQRADNTGFVSVTNNDEEILADVRSGLGRLGLNYFTREPHEGKSAKEVICSAGEFVSFLDGLSPRILDGSAEQLVPDQIKRTSPKIKSAFLRAFVEAEGHVSKKEREITVASMSRELLEGVRSLLLSRSIESQLHERHNGSYRLRISGNEFTRYVQRVGFVTERKSIDAAAFDSERNTNRDVIPGVGPALRELREDIGLTQHECGIPRTTYQHYERGDRNPSRSSLQSVVETFDSQLSEESLVADGGLLSGNSTASPRERLNRLRGLVDAPVSWQKIEEIESIEPNEEWVYDLEVTGTHNYLSNNIVSHNSQLLSYIRHIAPRSVYTSGKGTSSAGLCVTGDTLVHTDDGFRQIADIVTKELPEPVETETAVEREVGVQTFDRSAGEMDTADSSHVWRMPEKPCRRIETSHGKELEASRNTPVLTCGTDGIEWRPISAVEAGDHVAVPRYGKIDRETVPVGEFLELTSEKLRLSDDSVERLRDGLREEFGTLRRAASALDLTEPFVYDSLPNRHVPLDKLRRILTAVDLSLDDIEIERAMLRHGDSVTVPEEFDADLMYLLGLVFGDGDISLDRRDGNRGMVRISNSDEGLLRRAADIFAEQFDKRPEIERQEDRVSCIRVNSATIARLFHNAGMESPKADLALHPRLTTAKHTDAFLRGLMDADGSVSSRTGGGSSLVFSTISDELARQVQLMLETYGVRARTRERDRRGEYELADGSIIESNHIQQFLEVYGADIDRYAEQIGFESVEKREALGEITDQSSRRGEKIPVGEAVSSTATAGGEYYNNVTRSYDPGRARARSMLDDLDLGDSTELVREAVEADLRWDKVVAAVDTGEKEVFDLTVPETHNFVGNGLVTHNTAAAVQDDFGDGQQWTLEAGALVLADKGIAAVDELDKMNPDDRSAMHEGLEQQEISISKAGINATLKSRCSLLGAANPKYGRFDQYEPIGEQIDLEPALISRFDLIFTVTDQPDPEEDANLADHIINTNYAGELHTQRTNTTNSNFTQEQVDEATEDVAPEIEPELLRKYIAYAKRTCYPTMTDEAKQAIRDFYVDLRAKGADEDAPVPVTARKLEAIVRLSEASARVRLSDTVELEDAERVIEIVRSCLQDIGVDPETGQFDADVVETGRSKTQRDRVKNIRQLINDIEDEYEQGAPVDEVLERAEDVGMDRSKAEHEIEKLRRQGEVYEPSSGHLRTT